MQGVEGFGFRLRFPCLHPYAYASNGTHTTQSLACVLPLCHPDFVKSFYSIQEEHKAECVCFSYIFFNRTKSAMLVNVSLMPLHS